MEVNSCAGRSLACPGEAASPPVAGMSQVRTSAAHWGWGSSRACWNRVLFLRQLPSWPLPLPLVPRGVEKLPAGREMHATSFPPKGAAPWHHRSRETTVCPRQGFLLAVIFVNQETFLFWTGNSLSFALGFLFLFFIFCGDVRGRQRGCSFSNGRKSSDRHA